MGGVPSPHQSQALELFACWSLSSGDAFFSSSWPTWGKMSAILGPHSGDGLLQGEKLCAQSLPRIPLRADRLLISMCRPPGTTCRAAALLVWFELHLTVAGSNSPEPSQCGSGKTNPWRPPGLQPTPQPTRATPTEPTHSITGVLHISILAVCFFLL